MTTERASFPMPRVTIETAPFWEGLKKGLLLGQRCAQCKHFRYPPRSHCPHCQSSAAEWVPLSGRGTVYSYVTYVRPWHPLWNNKVPYNLSIIELEERILLYSNVVECDPEEVHIGMPVEVIYEQVDEGLTLPKFRPGKERA